MKNKLSVKEKKILDDSFATLENAVHCLIDNEQFSVENIFKAIHYVYEMEQGECPTVAMGIGREGKPTLFEFLEYIGQHEQPMTTWPDAEEEVLRGGDKE